MTVDNYLIDRKLKAGKDYPPELIRLTNYFNKAWEIHDPGGRRELRQQRKEMVQIERIFNDFFFHRSKVLEFDRKHPDLAVRSLNLALEPPFVTRKEDYWKAFLDEKGEDSRGIINRCIKKANAKLKLTNPQLAEKGGTYYITPTEIRPERRYFERNKGSVIQCWILLAKVIEKLDPILYKRCAYCKQAFFSRQRKKYHTECRSKYFSEKYKRDGSNAAKMRQYRLRKKQESQSKL